MSTAHTPSTRFPRPRLTRAAAAVPVVRVGAVDRNTEAIVELYESACTQHADVVVFPELALCGYTIADLVHQRAVVEACAEALDHLAAATVDRSTVALVGAPLVIGPKLYNVAAVLCGGEVAAVVPKRWLPTYGEFYEQRWFADAGDLNAPPTVFDAGAWHLGVEVCEDLWVPEPPSGRLALGGAEVIANLSASNEILGKQEWRRTLIRAQSGRLMCGYVYVSSGVGESTADTVFGGSAFIAENGSILAEAPRFTREPQLVLADLDVDALARDRWRNTSFRPDPSCEVEHVTLRIAPAEPPADLRRYVDAHPFVPDDDTARRERCEEILAIAANGLISAMDAARCDHLVLGVSGGLDSTLAAVTAVRALDVAGRSRANLHVLVMPGPASSGRTQSNAEVLARRLGASVRVVSIAELTESALGAIGHDGTTEDVTFENTQARLRTLLLMNTANLERALVVGTGDLSELALGWCTFNGDHMSMYNVNVGIPKTLVRHVVATAAAWDEFDPVAEVLHDIIDTPISPELTGGGAGIEQRTEDIVGPYELTDFFLYRFVRFGDRPDKVAYLAAVAFDGRYGDDEIAHWLGEFLRRFTASQFKRDALPNGPKVGTVALSPRADWRMSPQAGDWFGDAPQ